MRGPGLYRSYSFRTCVSIAPLWDQSLGENGGCVLDLQTLSYKHTVAVIQPSQVGYSEAVKKTVI